MKISPPPKVKVIHHQTIRQSHNYQSAEVSYGIEIPCDNDELSIKKAYRKAESLVESVLVKKLQQQKELLNGLSGKTD